MGVLFFRAHPINLFQASHPPKKYTFHVHFPEKKVRGAQIQGVGGGTQLHFPSFFFFLNLTLRFVEVGGMGLQLAIFASSPNNWHRGVGGCLFGGGRKGGITSKKKISEEVAEEDVVAAAAAVAAAVASLRLPLPHNFIFFSSFSSSSSSSTGKCQCERKKIP